MSEQENKQNVDSGNAGAGDEWGAAAPKSEKVEPPKKRGRGRPTNAERAATLEQRIEGDKPQGSAKKSKAKERTTFSDEMKSALAEQVVGIHMLAAMATGLPELQISKTEGGLLANGMVAVAEEYGLELTGKVGAGLQLLGVAAVIYVPRFLQIKKRRDAQRPIDGAITENTQG